MAERIDILLVQRNLATGRSQAKDLITRGKVLCQGETVKKAGQLIEEEAEITVLQDTQFVGRGGEKLQGAILQLGLLDQIQGIVAADIGASTGGFTQYLLFQGATRVYAVDVGHDQLAPLLRQDPRVINMEGINVKNSVELPEFVDLAVVDLSFISLRKVLHNIVSLLNEQGLIIMLFKPQFEVGREGVKKGIVKSPELANESLASFLTWIEENEDLPLKITSVIPSELKGKKGNQEYFIFGHRQQKRGL